MNGKKIVALIEKYRKAGFSLAFCRDEYFVDEFRMIFPEYRFTHDDVPKIIKYFAQENLLTSMTESWNGALRLFEDKQNKAEKEKIKKEYVNRLNKEAAVACIKDGMASRGMRYCIEEFEYRLVVTIVVANKWQVSFSITYSKWEFEAKQLFANIDCVTSVQNNGMPIIRLTKIDHRKAWEGNAGIHKK